MKEEYSNLEQYYCFEFYSELLVIVNGHKDLKRFSDQGIILILHYTDDSFRSRIEIRDLFQRNFVTTISFRPDCITLVDSTLHISVYSLSQDGYCHCIRELEHKVFPRILQSLNKDCMYLSLTASYLLEEEFGYDNIMVGGIFGRSINIDILEGNSIIYIDFNSNFNNCTVSSNNTLDTYPSSFTTVDEWIKYLSTLVSNLIV